MAAKPFMSSTCLPKPLSFTSDDDDCTLYSDVDSMYSVSDVSANSSESYSAIDTLPTFRLAGVDGDKPAVYEAWNVYLSADLKKIVSGVKVCGISAFQRYRQFRGSISTTSELYDQGELSQMHLDTLSEYHAKNERTWASRLIRGPARSYEDDIDRRIRKLPGPVQSEINQLLADRENASSNRYHNRAWTVVLMQEQLHYRFADANPTAVKKHKVRFWKNPGKGTCRDYFIIIRGTEGRPVNDEKGVRAFKRFGNPWKDADKAECREKARQGKIKRTVDRMKPNPPGTPRPWGEPSPRSPRESHLYAPPPPRPQFMVPGSSHRPPAYSPAPGYFCPPAAPTPPVSYPPPPGAPGAGGVPHPTVYPYQHQQQPTASRLPPTRPSVTYYSAGLTQDPRFGHPPTGHTFYNYRAPTYFNPRPMYTPERYSFQPPPVPTFSMTPAVSQPPPTRPVPFSDVRHTSGFQITDSQPPAGVDHAECSGISCAICRHRNPTNHGTDPARPPSLPPAPESCSAQPSPPPPGRGVPSPLGLYPRWQSAPDLRRFSGGDAGNLVNSPVPVEKEEVADK